LVKKKAGNFDESFIDNGLKLLYSKIPGPRCSREGEATLAVEPDYSRRTRFAEFPGGEEEGCQ